MRISFVTSAAHSGLTQDDRIAADLLTRRGAVVNASIWDDPAVDWTEFDAIVLRSTWDYYDRAEEFSAWIDSLDAIEAPLWNPPRVLRWSMHKSYLRDLERAGVPVVPTVWLAMDGAARLGDILTDRGWSEAIVKPVISANASRTWRTSLSAASAHNSRLTDALSTGGMMVQPFVTEIQTRGEWSMMFIDGEFSHAVRKLPGAGDFRVQESYGGTVATDQPLEAVLAVAQHAVRVAPAPWMYARVDGVETSSGFMLLELEMLEPSFYFGFTSTGADRFADAILSRVAAPR